MTLHLTNQQQNQLIALQRMLLAPFEYEDMDRWGYAVAMGLNKLFGTDRSYFLLPLSEKHVYPASFSSVRHYFDYVSQLKYHGEAWRRAVSLGVHQRESVFKPWWHDFSQSAYYQEFIPSVKGFSSVGASVLLHPGDEPNARTVGQLLVTFERPQDFAEKERNLSMMQFVYPVFKSGLQSFVSLLGHTERLGGTLDRLDLAMLLCDADGNVLHQTPHLSNLLAEDPQGAQIHAAMCHLARALTRLEASKDVSDHQAHQIISSPKGVYRICVSYLAHPLGMERAVMVRLEPVQTPRPTISKLTNTFGLTEQQARVALLLAQRKTNQEIARRLHISIHTARHHVEAVLFKLGLTSRRLVRERIEDETS